MDLNYLRRLVKIFDDSTADSLEITEEGIKIKIGKNPNNSQSSVQYKEAIVPTVPMVQPVQSNLQEEKPKAVAQSETKSTEKELVDSKLHTIVSPIVGTFYKAPSPDSASFVEIGSRVKPGDTLCIIEAMKLMNEIESDVSGTVEKILVDNAQPIEYNQPIFLIKLD